MACIYFTEIPGDADDDYFFSLLDLVPAPIQGKLERYGSRTDALRSLLGKLLLKRMLEDNRPDLRLDDLSYSVFGRPFIGNGFDFNISHSGRLVVCAGITRGRIGIDIEEVRVISLDDFSGQFNGEEWGRILSSASPLKQFYEFWTVKESVLKAAGSGFYEPPLSVIIADGTARLGDSTYHLRRLPFGEDYTACLATDKPLTDYRVQRFTFEKRPTV